MITIIVTITTTITYVTITITIQNTKETTNNQQHRLINKEELNNEITAK